MAAGQLPSARFTCDHAAGEPRDALDLRDVVVLEVFVTRSAQLRAVAEVPPQVRGFLQRGGGGDGRSVCAVEALASVSGVRRRLGEHQQRLHTVTVLQLVLRQTPVPQHTHSAAQPLVSQPVNHSQRPIGGAAVAKNHFSIHPYGFACF